MLRIGSLETRVKFRLREITLCWEVVRGCRERLTAEFWTRGKKEESEGLNFFFFFFF